MRVVHWRIENREMPVARLTWLNVSPDWWRETACRRVASLGDDCVPGPETDGSSPKVMKISNGLLRLIDLRIEGKVPRVGFEPTLSVV